MSSLAYGHSLLTRGDVKMRTVNALASGSIDALASPPDSAAWPLEKYTSLDLAGRLELFLSFLVSLCDLFSA